MGCKQQLRMVVWRQAEAGLGVCSGEGDRGERAEGTPGNCLYFWLSAPAPTHFTHLIHTHPLSILAMHFSPNKLH